MTAMYARYQTTLGDVPPPAEECAAEQLTALHHVVDRGSPPYVDMAVLGQQACGP